MDNSSDGMVVPISRGNVTTLAFQLDGLCEGLTTAAQLEQPIGNSTRALFANLLNEARKIGSGRAFELLPSVQDDASVGDL